MSDITEAGYLIGNDDLARLGDGDVSDGRRRLRLLMADERAPKRISGPTERPGDVRVATEKDEPALLELLLLDLKETAGRIAPVSPERVLAHIQIGTRHKGGIVGVIDGPAGKPVAVVILMPVQWWFSESRFIQESPLYVHPAHRDGHHARDLILFARWVADEWSRGFGYRTLLISGLMTMTKAKQKTRFYRRFLNQIGAFYCYPFVGEG